jgi:hypothetical protein
MFVSPLFLSHVVFPAVLAGIVAVAIGLVGAILGQRFERKRVEQARLRRLDAESAQSGARLARVETMLDGLTVEMERVSESQRFVNRLLTDSALTRSELPRPSRSPIPPSTRYDSPVPRS